MITKSRAIVSNSFLRALIIGGLLLALAACSALRLSYGQGPNIAYWWIDRYVDLDPAQSRRAREALNEWFEWHRTTQLGDLDRLLGKARSEAMQPATAAQVCRWADEMTDRLLLAYDHAVPAIADIVPTLRPEQLQRLESRYQRNNREFRADYLQPDLEDRLHAAIDRTVDRAESIYGGLSGEQLALVRRALAASPFDPQLWYAERRARQQEILDRLRQWSTERPPQQVVQAGLRALAQGIRRSNREPYRTYQQRLLEYNCGFIAELHNSTTPQQRRHAVEKLKAWQDDLRALAAEAAP